MIGLQIINGGIYKMINKFNIIIFSIFICGCSMGINSHPLTDRNYNVHYYNEQIPISNKNEPSVQFCQTHYRWETIESFYGKDGINYIVRNINKGGV